ncbi:hypothetical protein Tsubulata_015372 [Turnera subulata]|uniref:HR-like lesion-inducer n=1 Tax=Turnera subulata TaxID=218843 RepID=A0A9Q0GCY6_9ROSI|nr:hypothetical protein Tsubulata_015372 [Turnera subulata]
MGFISILGRVLFASVFLISAWKMLKHSDTLEISDSVVEEWTEKLAALNKHVPIPDGVDSKHCILFSIILKVVGGCLLVFDCKYGAYSLLIYLAVVSPILYDFYNYRSDMPKFVILLNDFLQNVALFGALLFFIGMKKSIPRRQPKKKGTLKVKAG